MRSDYMLYTVAVIFFILTAISAFALSDTERSLSVIATAVLGLLFIGLGYSQKSKAFEAYPSPVPSVPEEISREETETTMEATSTITTLTGIRGIGEKRAEQLKGLGINSLEDLSSASANELAAELKISPKMTGRWIEDAKKLAEKS